MLAEEKIRQTRNLPIIIICPNTRHRIINQIIYEEYIRSIWTKKSNWTKAAQERLLQFGIELTTSALINYKKEIKEGHRDPVCISNFSGGVFDGAYASRYGKDNMYKQFKLLTSISIKDPTYIGLPANQILSVNKEYGADNVYACERNIDMAQFMFDLQRHFSPPGEISHLINQDIFNYLLITDNKFSVYDLDLMCQVSEIFIDTLINCITKTSKDKCVVNVATSVGRGITNKQYDSLMPSVFIEKISNKMKVLAHYSDGYNDRVVPMRYEFFVLERINNEN
jgi:hypothetical protein